MFLPIAWVLNNFLNFCLTLMVISLSRKQLCTRAYACIYSNKSSIIAKVINKRIVQITTSLKYLALQIVQDKLHSYQ